MPLEFQIKNWCGNIYIYKREREKSQTHKHLDSQTCSPQNDMVNERLLSAPSIYFLTEKSHLYEGFSLHCSHNFETNIFLPVTIEYDS